VGVQAGRHLAAVGLQVLDLLGGEPCGGWGGGGGGWKGTSL
jgi:hypothetical protein